MIFFTQWIVTGEYVRASKFSQLEFPPGAPWRSAEPNFWGPHAVLYSCDLWLQCTIMEKMQRFNHG
jgi:hypothetical protein